MPSSNEALFKRYTLTGGENTFSSPACTGAEDARKLQSLIPSLAGNLEREHPLIPFTADAAFASRIGFFHQFGRNDNGVITRHYFCATSTTLYKLQNPGIGQVWVTVAAVGSLAGFPVAVNINNQMHLSDNAKNWIFDGTNWVTDGLLIPLHAPAFTKQAAGTPVAISSISRLNGIVTVNFASSGFNLNDHVTIASTGDATFNTAFTVDVAGGNAQIKFNQKGFLDASLGVGGTIVATSFSVIANRYYWTTFGDQSATHPHESSSSPISGGTGAFTGTSLVTQRPGTIQTSSGSPNVVGTGTDFSSDDVGMVLRYRVTDVPIIIASVQDAQHLTLATAAGYSDLGGLCTIAPSRATHWNIYASSSEEDKQGNFLAAVPIAKASYLDQSPMIGTVGSYFSSVNRPLLNDPANATKIMEVYKNRIWRVPPNFPNFYSYTAYEEVLAEQAGTPSECVPGADDLHTVSPAQVNKTSYPDQSASITGIRKHGDALYIGTEQNITPLYGSSLADFQPSEAQAFAVGLAGRKASCSTPFGFAFVSYDLKVYLYPSQYSFGVDSTTALIELGRPKRPEFELIDGADFENVDMKFYNWGRRNWLVLSYRRTDQTFGTWVFDFETKGWFQLQQGYTALAVFEMTKGRKTLIGAGVDNKIYVIDDLTGNFTPDPATNYPVGYFRQLVDFGEPDSEFEILGIGYEKSNSDMVVDVTIWLDPLDPDNPGPGIPIFMNVTKIGANSFNGRTNAATGGTCQRVLIEFAVAASPLNGRFHGFTLEAKKIKTPVL